jgi:hypothetical protein
MGRRQEGKEKGKREQVAHSKWYCHITITCCVLDTRIGQVQRVEKNVEANK